MYKKPIIGNDGLFTCLYGEPYPPSGHPFFSWMSDFVTYITNSEMRYTIVMAVTPNTNVMAVCAL